MNDLALGRAVVTYTVMNGHPRRKGEEFPLTGGWVQRLSRRLGHPVGEHRALRIISLLIEQKVVVPAGSYRRAYHLRQPSGWRVRLFKLPPTTRHKASVRRPRIVKRVSRQNWWADPLCGNPDQRPPPKLRRLVAVGWGGRIEYEAWRA